MSSPIAYRAAWVVDLGRRHGNALEDLNDADGGWTTLWSSNAYRSRVDALAASTVAYDAVPAVTAWTNRSWKATTSALNF